ncbi:MAG: DNA polymerase III subunit delta' [Desulfobacterales bacterium]|nr:DNA polymerase III subunit delta' [Desulfobacterales bacterium]
MPGFASIIGQDTSKGVLKALLKNGTLPHALLFTGVPGLGKTDAAIAVAQACNCTGQGHQPDPGCRSGLTYPTEGCGVCRSCRKIEEGTHPDLIRIAPKGQMIRIETIRELLQTLAMKPYEARVRMVILTSADDLNQSAGNALLKVLEEPPARTVLVLTAQQRSDLLPTIVSRCQHLRFHPVRRQLLEETLTTHHGICARDAAVLATLAGGSIGRALDLKRTHWIRRRNWLINEIQALPSRRFGALLALAEVLGRNRKTVDTDLAVIELYLRDLAVGRHCPDRIANMDLTDQIRYASRTTTTASVLSGMNAIDNARDSLRANGNLRLTLDTLILRLTQALSI